MLFRLSFIKWWLSFKNSKSGYILQRLYNYYKFQIVIGIFGGQDVPEQWDNLCKKLSITKILNHGVDWKEFSITAFKRVFIVSACQGLPLKYTVYSI